MTPVAWFWFAMFIFACICGGCETWKRKATERKLAGQRRRIVELDDAVAYWRQRTIDTAAEAAQIKRELAHEHAIVCELVEERMERAYVPLSAPGKPIIGVWVN